MTDPVILLGTQSNGETLPVQVDGFGRLVAEGLQGPEGPEGPPGIGQLPSDPYEGALLGWLNGELAWVSGGIVPIPEGTFGPIASWDPQNGVLVVDGEIPATISNGTYLYQVDNKGNLVSPGKNVEQDWQSFVSGPYASSHPPSHAFDGDMTTYCCAQNSGGVMTAQITGLTPNAEVMVDTYENNSGGGNQPSNDAYIDINGTRYVASTQSGVYQRTGNVTADGRLNLTWTQTKNGGSGGYLFVCIHRVSVSNVPLIDPDLALSFRVNQKAGNMLLGNANNGNQFIPGLYLKAPAQQVATWVYLGVDPTSRIDDLRSS